MGTNGLFGKKKTWLLIDVSCLAYRSFYGMRRLSHDDIPTTIVYSLLRDVLALQDRYDTHDIAFCFDGGYEHRTAICPEYKQNRKHDVLDAEMEANRKELLVQIKALRETYLTQVGWKNVFYQPGYEADDILAWIVKNGNSLDEHIIVSSDQDLWQLLSPNCLIHNPMTGKPLTAEKVLKDHFIDPVHWWKVKAIAGCTSDNIQGIQGVGEVFAVKFLTGKLPPDSSRYKKIKDGVSIIRRNKLLTKLPMAGCGPFELVDCMIDYRQWNKLLYDLGIHSLPKPKRTKG
jgi:DNA polymerase-1